MWMLGRAGTLLRRKLLAAHALGYGAVPMTGPVVAIPEALGRLARVPAGFTPDLVVALGRPAESTAPSTPRKELSAISTWIEEEP